MEECLRSEQTPNQCISRVYILVRPFWFPFSSNLFHLCPMLIGPVFARNNRNLKQYIKEVATVGFWLRMCVHRRSGGRFCMVLTVLAVLTDANQAIILSRYGRTILRLLGVRGEGHRVLVSSAIFNVKYAAYF